MVLNKLEVMASLGYYTFDRNDLDSPVAHLGAVYHFSSLLPWRNGIGLQLGRPLGAEMSSGGGKVHLSYNILDVFYNLELRLTRRAAFTGRLGVQNLSGELDNTALLVKLGLSLYLN